MNQMYDRKDKLCKQTEIDQSSGGCWRVQDVYVRKKVRDKELEVPDKIKQRLVSGVPVQLRLTIKRDVVDYYNIKINQNRFGQKVDDTFSRQCLRSAEDCSRVSPKKSSVRKIHYVS